MSQQVPAGWYTNPEDPTQLRYWDGSAWTSYTTPDPTMLRSSPSPPPPPPSSPPPPTYGFGSSGPPSYGAPPSTFSGIKPDSYLVWAILATLFCCLPSGIVSIVNASKVDSAWASGQVDEARRRSDAARRWVLISVVASVAAYGLWVLLLVGTAVGG